MKAEQAHDILAAQQSYFAQGATRSYEARIQSLERLKKTLLDNQERLLQALQTDLGKPKFEALVMELGLVHEEIALAKKKLKSWMKPKRVATSMALWPARSRVLREPYGQVLVISPFNYPVQLALNPVVGALAAGNTVVLKPSEEASATAELIADMVKQSFDPGLFTVCLGGPEVSQALLAQRFNYMFFTGGERVGRIVAEAAAKHLIPCTLELGGKSPCIVRSDCKLEVAARRIVWGKFANAGQTCVAPDYLLVEKSFEPQLVAELKRQINDFFGNDPSQSPDFGRVISTRSFDRLTEMLDADGTQIVAGGERDRDQRFIAPTLVQNPAPEHPLMQGEIFGPILPILTWEEEEDIKKIVLRHPKPLALYVFSEDTAFQDRVLRGLDFGGAGVNETIAFIATPFMPFGGVGPSGMGAYHGESSFETFTYAKSIMQNPTSVDVPVRYPPYKNKHKLAPWLFPMS